MKGSVVGLIPVKGSSDRVKQKNLRDFAGSSLLEVKLNQLKDAKGFEDLIVSSEDDEVLQIAKKHGFSIHTRDPKYSTSDVPMSDVYSHIASEIKGDNIAWINVTNPLAECMIYTEAVELYNSIEPAYDCLLSSILLQENVFYEGEPVNFTPYPWPKSQDLKGLKSLTFVINILKRKDMVAWGSCVGNAPYFYELDKIDSWDIDDQADFDFCEFMYKQRFNK
tara:strand:- start:4090 stop:4755 length:666 start_codon:yes stop_codon:yes gene_type:complete